MSLLVSEINIYPIKSLGGISLQASDVLQKGLRHDRRWMLMDEDNVFLTQRIHNRMALFRMSFADNGFNVSYDGQQLNIPFTMEGDPVRAKIWDDEVTVQEVSSAHSDWFSKNLGLPVRLVAFPEGNERPIDPKYRLGDDHVSLADAYPLLIIGQSSLDDLNRRLDDPVPMNRFRPSIVFTGGDPFEEDTWGMFTTGGASFAGVKPCKRCVLITVDQQTGVKGTEPLVTLSKYRKKDNGVYFGQNVIPTTTGKISIGDEIIINNSVHVHTA
jgi:uncharacterized protein YcbX